MKKIMMMLFMATVALTASAQNTLRDNGTFTLQPKVGLGFGTGIFITDGNGSLTLLLGGVLAGAEDDGGGIGAVGRGAGQTTPAPPTLERKRTAGGVAGAGLPGS